MTPEAHKANLRRLLRVRSLDESTVPWERVWKEAGCASGLIDDMDVHQMIAVTERVQRIAPGRKAG